jgi:hypothetical protein
MSAFVPERPAAETGDVDRDIDSDPDEQPSAAERLAASRERMRLWMLQTDGRADARRRVAAAREAGDEPAWIDRLRAAPVIGIVIDAVDAWWSSHPMKPAAQIAHGVVRDTVAPIARRHPLLVVGGAFLAGVALVRLRPWRWLIKPALFAGLGSQIITRVVAAVPLESVLEAIGSFAGRRSRKDDEEPVAPASGPAVPEPVAEAETVTP